MFPASVKFPCHSFRRGISISRVICLSFRQKSSYFSDKKRSFKIVRPVQKEQPNRTGRTESSGTRHLLPVISSVDRCQNDLLAAGAPFCGEAYRKTAAHDRAAGVSRFRLRLHAAADPSLFRNQSSCLLCVRFPFKHKYLLFFMPASLPDIPQKLLANSMPNIISGESGYRKNLLHPVFEHGRSDFESCLMRVEPRQDSNCG